MNKKLIFILLILLLIPSASALCIPFVQDCSQDIIIIQRGSNEDVNYSWIDTMEFAFEQPAKNVDVEIIGAELIISSSSSISSGSPINISTGISKLQLTVLSGADTTGDITLNAVKHDRDTGVTTEPYSESLALDGVGDMAMSAEWIGNKTASDDINLTTTNFDGVLQLTQWSFYQDLDDDFNILRVSVTIETADTASAKSFDFNFFKVGGDGNVNALVEFNDIDFAPNGIARNRIYRLDRNCIDSECFIDTSTDGIHAAFDQSNIETVEVIITYGFIRQLQVSGVAGNNVTRLIAGSNIALSPGDGLGDVTITSTGGAAGDFVTSTVYNAGFPVNDANVDNDITLTNITQITNRSYTDLQNLPFIPSTAAWDANYLVNVWNSDFNGNWLDLFTGQNISLLTNDSGFITSAGTDTTLDSNATADASYLAKDHYWTGFNDFNVFGTGNVLANEFDAQFGNDENGAISIGGKFQLAKLGGIGAVGDMNVDGIIIFRRMDDGDNNILFLFANETEINFALAKPLAELAAYIPRSFMIGGDLGNAYDDRIINCGEQGYTFIDCETDLTGADLGIQDDLEVHGSISINRAGDLNTFTANIDNNLNIRQLTYSWPSARGTNGQLLTEDGKGNLTWTTVSGAGISEADGNALYVKLNPTAGQVISGFDLNLTADILTTVFKNTNVGVTEVTLNFESDWSALNNTDNILGTIAASPDSATGGRLVFYTSTPAGTLNEGMRIGANNNLTVVNDVYVGRDLSIGHAVPLVALHLKDSADVPMRIETTGSGAPGFDLFNASGRVGTFGVATAIDQFVTGSAVDDFVFRADAGGDFLFSDSAGTTINMQIAETGEVTATGFTGALTGNADTATALETARTIGLVSFDGTANIVPLNIVVADESSDTTTFPAFFTGTVGNLRPKTGSNLTFNSSSGLLGSTSYTATDDITAGDSIFTSLGAESTPAWSFTGDEDTGIGSAGANTINVSVGGDSIVEFDATSVNISPNLVVEAELQGSRQSVLLSRDASFTVSSGHGGNQFVKAGEVIMTISKGVVMTRAGSIVGISIMYDVTATSGTLTLNALVNGTSVWANTLNSTVAAQKVDSFTQARDTDTFSADNDLQVSLTSSGSHDVDDVIVTLEIQYDT